MASQIVSLVGAALAAYLPGDNHLYKHLIGTAVSDLLLTLTQRCQRSETWQALTQRRVRPQRRYELAVFNKPGRSADVYSRLEQLLKEKQQSTVSKAVLQFENGGEATVRHQLAAQLEAINTGIYPQDSVEVPIRYLDQMVYISVVPSTLRIQRFGSAKPTTSADTETQQKNPPIWITSDNVTTEGLKNYIKTLTSTPNRYEMMVTADDETLHIYDGLEEWILAHSEQKLHKSRAKVKGGQLAIMPLVLNQSVQTTFEKHTIQVGLRWQPKDEDTQIAVNAHPPIWLVSRTADVATLHRFLLTVVNVEKPRVARTLRLHRCIIAKSRKRRGRKQDDTMEARWVLEYTITNKTIQNTIVAEHVERDLYDDVRKFLGAEAYYAKKGLPWKRGYFLHGPPGTGKTSLIKAIANEFGMDIFSIDMACIETDSQLIALTSQISHKKNGKRYILAFEDIDRSDMFSRYRNERRTKLTKQCLLNVLDGISESYGRILFFTGNDSENVTRTPAMVRPGRIDACIAIDLVTARQLARMFCLFYDALDETAFMAQYLARVEEHMLAQEGIAPAAVMEAMLKHDDDWKGAYRKLMGCTIAADSDNTDVVLEEDDDEDANDDDDDAAATNPQRITVRKSKRLRDMEARQRRLTATIQRTEKAMQRLDDSKTRLERLNLQIESVRQAAKAQRMRVLEDELAALQQAQTCKKRKHDTITRGPPSERTLRAAKRAKQQRR